MRIVKAEWGEHKAVCAVARLSKFSKGFASGGLRYVDSYYAQGWVLVAKERSKLLGFVCVRHCTRVAHTSVYYLGVATKRRGVGTALIKAVQKDSSWPTLELISEKENEEGFKFYKALGFKVVGDGADSKGVPYWRLHLES